MTQQALVTTTPLTLATISKAPLLGFRQQMTGVEVALAADQFMHTVREEDPEAPLRAISDLNFEEDYVPAVIAAIEKSGQGLPGHLICNILDIDADVLGISTELVRGQQLGMLLRQLHLMNLQHEDNKNWLMQAQQIYDGFVREDWKIAGFKSWAQFILATTKVGGLGMQAATNRKNLIGKVMPRLGKIGVNVMVLFRHVKPSVADDMVGFLSDESVLDNDGLKFVCALIADGQVTSREDVADLKNSPAIRVWSKFAGQLRIAGLDPVERALNLGLAKLGPVAQFVTSGNVTAKLNDDEDEDGLLVPGFITQMERLALEFVKETCQTPHSRSADHTQVTDQFDDAPVEMSQKTPSAPYTVEIDQDEMDLMTTPGAQDEHTRVVLNVLANDANTGYITIEVKKLTIPVRLAQKLAASGDFDFVQDGKKHIFKRGVMVQAK